jgi:hypothetical protein
MQLVVRTAVPFHFWFCSGPVLLVGHDASWARVPIALGTLMHPIRVLVRWFVIETFMPTASHVAARSSTLHVVLARIQRSAMSLFTCCRPGRGKVLLTVDLIRQAQFVKRRFTGPYHVCHRDVK